MKSFLIAAAFALLCLPAHGQSSRPTPEPAAGPTSKPASNGETTKVKLKDLTLSVPGAWKRLGATPMRVATFSIYPVEGDTNGAEMAVYHFGPQSVDDNVQRWIKQFEEKDRQQKVTQGKATAGAYVFVDVSGTYKKSVGRPMGGKTQSVPGQRMLGVILTLDSTGVYFLKLVGPAKTVEAQAKALRSSFGAKAEGETKYKKSL